MLVTSPTQRFFPAVALLRIFVLLHDSTFHFNLRYGCQHEGRQGRGKIGGGQAGKTEVHSEPEVGLLCSSPELFC